MKKGFFDKLLGFVGFEEEEVEDDTEAVALEEDDYEYDRGRRERPSRAKVLNLAAAAPQLKSMRVVVLEPRSFEEVQQIADQLKEKRPVILNLDGADKAVARRVVDFVSGTVYALGGGMQRINPSIFLFTPPNVDIAMGSTPDGRPTFYTRERE